jgi:hypothetical protein
VLPIEETIIWNNVSISASSQMAEQAQEEKT